MACDKCINDITSIGADPANVQWKVVRGDTAVLRIEFFENDEKTYTDTTDYTYSASAYDPKLVETYTLDTEGGSGYVDIIAPPEVTTLWGSGNLQVVADLEFDLQVDIDGYIWTPVIGSICVIGDITRNSLA
jgi:hypothetical protein